MKFGQKYFFHTIIQYIENKKLIAKIAGKNKPSREICQKLSGWIYPDRYDISKISSEIEFIK